MESAQKSVTCHGLSKLRVLGTEQSCKDIEIERAIASYHNGGGSQKGLQWYLLDMYPSIRIPSNVFRLSAFRWDASQNTSVEDSFSIL